jgi:hypothetical protein
MTAPAIVADLGSRGIKLRVVGDRLQFAPRDLVGEAELAMIRAHKPALLDYLAGGAPRTTPSVELMSSAVPRWDDEHGIVIETPDRARMLAAVIDLPEGPGDADETRLEEHPRWIEAGLNHDNVMVTESSSAKGTILRSAS